MTCVEQEPHGPKMRAFIAAHFPICAYCRRMGTMEADPDGKHWTKDHIIPRAQTRKGTRNNCVLACSWCNKEKGSGTVEQFMPKLAHIPSKKRPRNWRA